MSASQESKYGGKTSHYNKAEIRATWEEMAFLSKEVFFDLLTYVFQKPFDYLLFDRDNNKYYYKWNI